MPQSIRELCAVAWMGALLAGCASPAGHVDPSVTPMALTTATSAHAPSPSPSPSTFSGQLEQRQETSMPQPREELAAAALDGTLFEIGGFDVNGRDTNTVFTYDGSWSLGPTLPEALDHPGAAVLLGQLYVAGGFSAGRARATAYRLAQGQWERIASLHHARAAFALVPLSGRLYALGGRDSAMASVAMTEVYDPLTDSWNDLPSLPSSRHHVAGFTNRGMVCAAGGKFPFSARVDCLDPASQVWSRLADLPQATSGAGAFMLDNATVVVGGESNVVVPWLFLLTDAGWQRQAMLLPRHGVQVAILGNRAWVCGGGLASGLHPSNLCTSIGSG